MVAGAAARSAVGFLLMPMTVVKTRMESSVIHSKGGISASLADIWRTLGIRGLFTGFWPTTLRDAPTAGLFLVVYERSRTVLQKMHVAQGSIIDASAGKFVMSR